MLRCFVENRDPEQRELILLQNVLRDKPRTGGGFPTARFGRGPNNDFEVSSRRVPLLLSRHTADFSTDGEQYWVREANTTNGIFVRTRAHRFAYF
jgi:hypothetical protein